MTKLKKALTFLFVVGIIGIIVYFALPPKDPPASSSPAAGTTTATTSAGTTTPAAGNTGGDAGGGAGGNTGGDPGAGQTTVSKLTGGFIAGISVTVILLVLLGIILFRYSHRSARVNTNNTLDRDVSVKMMKIARMLDPVKQIRAYVRLYKPEISETVKDTLQDKIQSDIEALLEDYKNSKASQAELNEDLNELRKIIEDDYNVSVEVKNELYTKIEKVRPNASDLRPATLTRNEIGQ
jgi:hypothetical protein